MTIARRGLRSIRVDGHDYLWKLNGDNCPCCRTHGILIVDAFRRGSMVHLPQPAYGSHVPITPALVAARIREARALGWAPGVGSGIFASLKGAE